MKSTEKKKLQAAGYFFHPGGDLSGEIHSPKKRGIWKTVDSPKKAVWVGTAWVDAKQRYDRESTI